MKKVTTIFCALICISFCAMAQANNDVISTMRMGLFKIYTPKAELEKIIGQKIQNKKGEYGDTAAINYGGANYTLVFNREYNEDTTKPIVWKLFSISSSTTLLKTKSLIGIGSNKADILKAYDKFDISIYNDYQYKEKGNTKDKIQYINLQDGDAGTMIQFTTENRIVTRIQVSIYEGD
jgi:hypothetical protein